MKRLTTAITNGELNDVYVFIKPTGDEQLYKMGLLDNGMVRSNKCPKCHYAPLQRNDGYKVCSNCGSVYKIINNTVYQVR